MNDAQENDIITRILRGQTEIYSLLIDAYKKTIFNLAYRMTGNYDDADDLTQETFIRVYERLGSFNPDKRFFTWLYTIALNVIRNHLKKGKETWTPCDPALSTQAGSCCDGDAGDEETYRRLDLCLHRLPDDMREALVLRFYQGLSFEEMAELLRISLSTAKMRVYRALQKLNNSLEQEKRNPSV